MSEISVYLEKLLRSQDLTVDESSRVFQILMSGGATPAQIASILVALRVKGETVDEITGGAITLRTKAGKITAPDNALDTCGTGGDGANTLNISTAVAIVVAAAGVPVAKHGNRAVSSKSGSADVLQQLGVNIDADTNLLEKSLNEANICFMMAPKFHMAMRHVAPVRQELGLRTIFNLLGPLANPASTKYQLLGVFDEKWVEPMANVLKELGTKGAWVVHGASGLDEISTTGFSHVASLRNGTIKEFEIHPEAFGLKVAEIEDIYGGDAAFNAQAIRELLQGKKDAYYDIVLLNSAACLLIAEKVDSIEKGLELAEQAVSSGQARMTLDNLVTISNESLEEAS